MKLSIYGNAPIITPRDPVLPMEAANKNYVDTSMNTHESDFTLHVTAAQNSFLDAVTVSATEVNELTGVISPVQTQLDSKVPLAGGSMTGFLTLSANPTSNLHATTKLYTDTQDALKVAKAGDTMTGLLTLSGDPTSNLHAATKQYVDTGLTTHATDNSLHLTAAENAFLDAVTVTATEVNELTGVTSNVQTQLDSKVPLGGGTMTGALVLSADPVANLGAATKHYVDTQDALKVAKSGDTMTGALVLPGDPTAALQAAPKQYVDTTVSTHASDMSLHLTSAQNTFIDAITVSSTEVNELAGVTSNVQSQLDSKVALAGSTMTGPLVLSADPSANLGAATKQYVDNHDALKVAKAGDTMTGALILSGDPTVSLGAATKQYVDSGLSTHEADMSVHLTSAQNTFLDAVTVSSTEVNHLAGVTADVQPQLDSKVPLAGGTMTGALVLSADPVANLGAATKQYTDAQDALKVAKAGDTMTGALTLSGDPTAALHATPKQYVDSHLNTHASDDTLHLTAAENAFLDAITVSASEVNELTGVTSNVQAQIDTKFDKAGGLISGDVTLEPGKTIFVSKIPAAGTELVNKAYVDSLVNGLKWEDPITDLNLVSDNLSAPPVSPVVDDVYIIGAAPTGAWAGKAGFATYFDGSSWVFLQNRPVAVGDRFGVALTSETAPSASLTTFAKQLVTVSSVTGGFTYVADVIAAGSTTLVFDEAAAKFGVTYTYNDAHVWVPTNTSVNLVAGDALSLSGNTLNLNHANGLEVNADILEVALEPSSALSFSAGGRVKVDLSGNSLTIDGTGVKVSDSVMSDIADRVSKTGSSTVTGTVAIATTGHLTTEASPTTSIDVVNKGYVDTADAALQSQVMTLQNTAANLTADPTTKTYVDAQDALKVAKAGDTMTGPLVLPADPTAALQATTKQYVDNNLSAHASDDALHLTFAENAFLDAITVSASEVNRLTGVSSNVQPQLDSKVPLAGGTMTGDLVLNADPSQNLQAATKQYTDAQDALKVAKAGDTMTGRLVLSDDPIAPMGAATKQFVESSVSTHASNDALHLTSAQNSFIDAITVSATEVNELSGVSSNVQTQLDSKLPLAGGTMTGAIELAADPVNPLEPSTKQYTDAADALKVAKAGDTMTGALTLSGNPTSALHATPKQYVDTNLDAHATDMALHMTSAQNTYLDNLTVTSTETNQLVGVTMNVQTQINSKLALAGGTMTGPLVLDSDPVNAQEAATKQYVDNTDVLKVNKAGDTMTGALVLPADPTSAMQATTKQYVDTNLTSHASDDSLHITAAQNTLLDGIVVGYTEVNMLEGVDENVQLQLNSKLNLSGGTMTGLLTLSADPSTNLGAATKHYVDTQDALKVAKSGDTMSGALILSGNPDQDLQAAPKQYVDSSITSLSNYVDTQDALKVAKAGDTMTGHLVLSGTPINALHAATKQYVDDGITSTVAYVDAADTVLQNQIGALQSTVTTLNSDPVTKSYVDAQDATKLNKSGGTMSGYIVLHADPQQSMHPTTKQYVDGLAQGLSTKPAVRLATTDNLAATYDNGSFGVNATLTGSSNGVLSVDGKTGIVGDRILVRCQTVKAQNGDYVVQQVGDINTPFILKRVNTVDESSEVPASYFFVSDGLTLKGTSWVFVVPDPVTFTIGTDDIAVNQFYGQGAYIAGNGMTISGNTFQVNTANPARIVVSADDIDLATTGVTPGSYSKVTVDGYGRVSAGSNPNTLAGYGITDGQPLNANLTSLSGVATTGIVVRDATDTMVTKAVTATGVGVTVGNGSGANSGNIVINSNATDVDSPNTIVSRDANGDFAAGVVTASLHGNATTATTLETARTFQITGDVTAPAQSFNGGANISLNTSLTDTGVAAGQYTKVTVDAKGRVTAGANFTVLADTGVQDVYTKAEVNALLAAQQAQFEELYMYVMSRI